MYAGYGGIPISNLAWGIVIGAVTRITMEKSNGNAGKWNSDDGWRMNYIHI
jgi:hypothetical protein